MGRNVQHSTAVTVVKRWESAGFGETAWETQDLRFNWQVFPWIGLWGDISSTDKNIRLLRGDSGTLGQAGFHDSRDRRALGPRRTFPPKEAHPSCHCLHENYSSHLKGI